MSVKSFNYCPLMINPVTGERIDWIFTGVEESSNYLNYSLTVPAAGGRPEAHVHPLQEEIIRVKNGAVNLHVGNETILLAEGHEYAIAKGQIHKWNNASASEPAELLISLIPALNSRLGIRKSFLLESDSRLKKGSLRYYLQALLLSKEYNEFTGNKPIWQQKVTWFISYPLSRLLRYTNYSAEYNGD